MPIYHEWNGTVLTITSDSGTSSANLKGEKGDDGARGAQGKPGDCVATDTAMLGGVPASEYALKSEIGNINLEGYATTEYVDNAINNIDIPNPDLTDYALKTDLNDYATKSYVAEEVAKASTGGEIDLSTYATKNYVDESIAAINTDDFALKTDIPSLDGYATEEYVDNAVSNVEVDLTGYATEEYVNTIVGGLDAGGGLELELLWTNANPTAAFGTNDINSSTDVSVNLTDVDNIGIIFRLYSGNEIYSPLHVIPTSTTNKIGVVAGAFTENIVSRQLTIKKAENKITFGFGSKNGDTMAYFDATMAIPYKIFAVKSGGASGGNADLTNYATKDYVDNAINNIDIPDTDLSNYYTKDETDTAINNGKQDLTDYATKEYVEEALKDIDLSDVDIDLSDYALKSDTIPPIGIVLPFWNNTEPASIWGGVWELLAEGLTLIQSGSTYPLGSTGGEAEHTLTESEIPSHRHIGRIGYQKNGFGYNTLTMETYLKSITTPLENTRDTPLNDIHVTNIAPTTDTGGSQSHNNMPPYLAVNLWKRTA